MILPRRAAWLMYTHLCERTSPCNVRDAVLLAARLSLPSPPCQGPAPHGRFARRDTATTARGTAAIEEDGGEVGHGIDAGKAKISVPLLAIF